MIFSSFFFRILFKTRQIFSQKSKSKTCVRWNFCPNGNVSRMMEILWNCLLQSFQIETLLYLINRKYPIHNGATIIVESKKLKISYNNADE